MITHQHVYEAFGRELWFLMPEYAHRMALVASLRLQGVKDHDAAAANAVAAEVRAARASNVSSASNGAVAVIPVFGTIMQRGNMMDFSGPGCASTEQLTRQINAAVNDPKIQAIILDFDTPGGSVSGVQELYDVIYGARGKKDIVGCVDSLCASAGYYLAAACSSIWATPSSRTGSIGVYCAHEDDSEYLAKQGVKVTLVQYGANKTLGNNIEPLSDAGRDELQQRVNSYGADFDKAVAKGRGITVAKVRSEFGQGKCFRASDAKAIGMVDRIGTLDQLLATYGVSRDSASGAMAMHVPGLTPVGEALTGVPSAAQASSLPDPKAENTADCPRGSDCPAQQEGITDSDDCPAGDDCPLQSGDDPDAKAQCAAAHAHRARLIQIASV